MAIDSALAAFAEGLAKASANRMTAGLGCGLLSLSAVETSKGLQPDNPLILYCQVAAWAFGALALIAVVWFLFRPKLPGGGAAGQ
jgi:hypothetical protein